MKIRIFLLIALLATLSSCGESKKNKPEAEHEHEEAENVVSLNKEQRDALNLKLGTFSMRNITNRIKINGQLEVPPAASAEVTAIIGGNVKSINVFYGDKVKKGQVLAILEHPDYISLQEDFAQTNSQLSFLKQELDRQKELFDNQVGSGKNFQQVKSEYNTANAKYEGLKARLRMLNLSPDDILQGNISGSIAIVSPINGYINDVNIKLGTYVDAKDKLFNITDNSEIHADFMVYENDVHLLREGQQIALTVANRPNEELQATIFAIGKEFEPNSRAVYIHAKLNSNSEGLIPGMYASGYIHTNENKVATLPNDAVVTDGSKSYIFILNEEGEEHHEGGEEEHEEANHETHADKQQFKMIEVITGIQEENYTEIKLLQNLPENTSIVLNSAYYLLADLGKEETEHEH